MKASETPNKTHWRGTEKISSVPRQFDQSREIKVSLVLVAPLPIVALFILIERPVLAIWFVTAVPV